MIQVWVIFLSHQEIEKWCPDGSVRRLRRPLNSVVQKKKQFYAGLYADSSGEDLSIHVTSDCDESVRDKMGN